MHDIFFFTDIHGCRPLFDAIMNYCKTQDPECSIIFGGDACDRGEDGYRIMKKLLADPQVSYLKGNHEDIFCAAARELKQEYHPYTPPTREEAHHFLSCTRGFDYRYEAIQASLYNGGMSTLTDWIMDGMPMDIVEQLEKLPYTFSYGKLDFCHSGGVYNSFMRVAEKEYSAQPVDKYAAEYLLWSRTSFDIDWKLGRTVVFGHTPTPYLHGYADCKPCDEAVPIKLSTGQLDMDTGAAFTGRAFVLNILTMQAQGFELKNDKVEEIEVIQF